MIVHYLIIIFSVDLLFFSLAEMNFRFDDFFFVPRANSATPKFHYSVSAFVSLSRCQSIYSIEKKIFDDILICVYLCLSFLIFAYLTTHSFTVWRFFSLLWFT